MLNRRALRQKLHSRWQKKRTKAMRWCEKRQALEAKVARFSSRAGARAAPVSRAQVRKTNGFSDSNQVFFRDRCGERTGRCRNSRSLGLDQPNLVKLLTSRRGRRAGFEKKLDLWFRFRSFCTPVRRSIECHTPASSAALLVKRTDLVPSMRRISALFRAPIVVRRAAKTPV